MKPIFSEEKHYLEWKLGLQILDNSWRDGNKIYLNHFDNKPYITFRVNLVENQLWHKKYIRATHKNYSLEEEYEVIKTSLDKKVRQSVDMTKKCILENMYKKVFVSISGGKDSDVMKDIVDKAYLELKKEGYGQFLKDYKLIAFNTSNESAETYKYLKEHHHMNKENIISPEIGFYQWLVKEKNYFIPTIFVRNCCSTYKEGQLDKVMNKKENTLTFLGMRSEESNKRSHYDWYLNESQIKAGKKLNVPGNWIRFLPIVKWTDAEIWLYILRNKKEFNTMYRLGFNRVGCLICPYQSDYVEMLLKEYYPKQWSRWVDINSVGFEKYRIERRLKWDELEWCEGGRWKEATSKEYNITLNKPTPKRIEELAFIKGISEEMASKYFKKECDCGKKLNPTEIAMNLKVFGRETQKYLCKKCLCKLLNINQNQYKEKVLEYLDEGCNLF